MPLPTPRKDETQNEFIARCGNDDKMEFEFPNEAQRIAVCYATWKASK